MQHYMYMILHKQIVNIESQLTVINNKLSLFTAANKEYKSAIAIGDSKNISTENLYKTIREREYSLAAKGVD